VQLWETCYKNTPTYVDFVSKPLNSYINNPFFHPLPLVVVEEVNAIVEKEKVKSNTYELSIQEANIPDLKRLCL